MKSIKKQSVLSRPGVFYEQTLSYDSRDNVIQRKKKRSTEEFGSTSNIKPKLKGFDDRHEVIRSHSSNPFERDSIPSSKIKEEGLTENEDEKIEEPREKVSPVLSSDLRRSLFSYN